MVFDLAQHRIRGTFEHIELLVRESFEQITKMYESGGEMTGTPTGFRDVDALTSGLQPGNLVVVAGRPSMGKSAFALGSPRTRDAAQGHAGRGLHAEMSKLEVAQRFMCSEARSSSSGRARAGSRPRLAAPREGVRRADEGARSTSTTRDDDDARDPLAKARRLKARGARPRPDHRSTTSSSMGSGLIEHRVQEVPQISRSLKMLAGDLEVPVIALCSLARAVESRTDKRPAPPTCASRADRAGRRPRDVPSTATSTTTRTPRIRASPR